MAVTVKPTQKDRGRLVSIVIDILELVRGAPVMVSVIYGVPILFLVLGTVAGLIVLANALCSLEGALRLPCEILHLAYSPLWLGANTDLYERLGIALVFLAFPAYWSLAGIYAGMVFALGGRRRTSPKAKFLQANNSSEDPLNTHDESIKQTGPLQIKAPPDKEGPPLAPWRQFSIGVDESKAIKWEPWPKEFRFRKIGLVLSGGGAKGIYQAGAMKAIYEFLHEKRALDCVVSIAATSIGAWNALFWMAGLLDSKTGNGEQSKHELWWTQTKLSQLVRPSTMIIPGIHRHLISNDPWKRQFDELFGRPKTDAHKRLTQILDDDPSIRFYMTRTHVLQGRLSFDTNNKRGVHAVKKQTHDLDQATLTNNIERLKQATFTSMGIPPLFDYTYLVGHDAMAYCEDGGVISNLPIRLGMYFDQCDLLFILPLNASFAQGTLPFSMPSRLARVIDMRQGMLERMELKSVYQFNQRYVFAGERNPVLAFAIAPGEKTMIHTSELWKLDRYGTVVFDQMYRATKKALNEFFVPENLWNFYSAYREMNDSKAAHKKLPENGYVRLTMVDPYWNNGSFEYEDRF